MYYFLLAVFNLIETQKDETPIIDTKGISEGKMTYGISLELYDTDKTTLLNTLDFENLNECIGKYMRMCVELKRVLDVPDRYTFQTKCTYKFLDREEPFETKVIDKTRNPEFNYKATHEFQITEDIIQQLMYNALTIGVYGMIESKRIERKVKKPEQTQGRDPDQKIEQEYK